MQELHIYTSAAKLCFAEGLCFRNMQAVVLQLFVAGMFVTAALATTPTGLVSIIFTVCKKLLRLE